MVRSPSITFITAAKNSSSYSSASQLFAFMMATESLIKVMSCPCPGVRQGGHQIRNESDSVARVLIVSSNANPDVAEYPETGKIGVVADGADWAFHRRVDAVDHAE